MKIKITESYLRSLIEQFLNEDATINDNGDVKFSEDDYEMVSEYIQDNMIDSRHGSGPYSDYYLPMDAKEFFDFIGFKNYEVIRVDNPEHKDYGKRYIEVSSWRL